MCESDIDVIAVLRERAEKRRLQLLQTHTFLPSREFSKLLTKREISMDGSLGDLLEKSIIIGVKVDDEFLYPVEQVNPAAGDVYPEISQVMMRGKEMHVDAWEVFDWLVRPALVYVSGSYVGDASDIPVGLTPKELVEAIKAKAARDPLVYKAVTPLEFLREKKLSDFWKLAKIWLGVADGYIESDATGHHKPRTLVYRSD